MKSTVAVYWKQKRDENDLNLISWTFNVTGHGPLPFYVHNFVTVKKNNNNNKERKNNKKIGISML